MKWVLIAVAVVLVAVVAFTTSKKVSPLSWGWWGTTNNESGIAVGGNDAVSYFSAGGPVIGNDDYTYQWADVTWRFADQENKDAFAAAPEKYAPQFGSFCSFAVSKGFTANADPQTFYVHDDRVYLFMDANVRQQWIDGIDNGTLHSSQENWAKRN